MSVAVADVNGDGKPDLVVTNHTSGSNGNGTVGVLLGNGDGTFQTAVTLRLGWVLCTFRGRGGCERGRQARPAW